jgi:pyrroloquinoline quinone biosynthesis protein E
MLTGDAAKADPVCGKSLDHGLIIQAREEAEYASQKIDEMAFRNDRNSRLIAKS